MTAAELAPGMHLQGMLPPVPGVRDDFAIGVVKDARCEDDGRGGCRVHVWWTDGTDCFYPPDHELHVLPAPAGWVEVA